MKKFNSEAFERRAAEFSEAGCTDGDPSGVMVLKIEINGLPKILSNGSQKNFWARENHKKHWKRLTMLAVTAAGWGSRPALTKAHAVFTRHSSREADFDNAVHSFKPVVDGLVQAGVLIDDKPSVLTREYRWEKASPKKGKITIEIFERG